MIKISVANDFSKTPGFRYESQSCGISGEKFRDEILEPKYLDALEKGEKLEITLDGTAGYLTSFLEEAFGGLKRKHPESNVLAVIDIISNDEKHWIQDIQRYVENALDQ